MMYSFYTCRCVSLNGIREKRVVFSCCGSSLFSPPINNKFLGTFCFIILSFTASANIFSDIMHFVLNLSIED